MGSVQWGVADAATDPSLSPARGSLTARRVKAITAIPISWRGKAIGAILLTTITSALTALRVDKFWQQAIVGVLILAAIIIDRLASIRTARRLRLSEARDV